MSEGNPGASFKETWTPRVVPTTIEELYTALNLENGASDDEVKLARRKFAKKFHSDAVQDADPAEQKRKRLVADERLKWVNSAADTLLDQSRRNQFGAGAIDIFGSPVSYRSEPPPRREWREQPRREERPEPPPRTEKAEKPQSPFKEFDAEYAGFASGMSDVMKKNYMDFIGNEAPLGDLLARGIRLAALFDQKSVEVTTHGLDGVERNFELQTLVQELISIIGKTVQYTGKETVIRSYETVMKSVPSASKLGRILLASLNSAYVNAFSNDVVMANFKGDLTIVERTLKRRLQEGSADPVRIEFYTACLRILATRKAQMLF